MIVMEYCNGGSLYSMLHEPHNVFGFEDHEFLTVVHDIAAGIHKLRTENVIHRDIKPGNIMRCIGLNGKTVYKLIDFDAARELLDDQDFQSIYGTEEYLHPQMYNRCFMNDPAEAAFPHSVDLWSIGATLYHVAAGQLPFQSFLGRKDRSSMSRIISGRGSRDISGVQLKRKGAIKYDQHLPTNIAMSAGLKPHVEELLVLLFAKETSFEDFFKKAEAMSLLRRISTFHYARTELLHLYLPPTTTYQAFQDILHQDAKIPPDEQLLIFQNLHFSTQFSSHSGQLVLKQTSSSDPVYLFSHQRHMPTQTGLDNRTFNFPNVSTYLKLDDSLWQPCLESLHYIVRAVVGVVERQTAIGGACKTFMQFIMRKFDLLENFKCHVTDLIQSHFSKLYSVQSLIAFVTTHHPSEMALCGLDHFKQHQATADKMQRQLAEVERQLRGTSADLQVLVGDWLCEKPSCRPEDCCEGQIRAWIKEVGEMRSKKNYSLEEASIQKEKLARALKTAKKLVEEHCQVNVRSLYSHFRNFMTAWWNIFEDLSKHEAQLSTTMTSLKLLAQQEQQSDEDRRSNLKIPSDLPSTTPSTPSTPTNTTPTNPTPCTKALASMMDRRETRESEFMRQLMSIVCEKKSSLLKEMMPLAEENNNLVNNIHHSLLHFLSQTKVHKEE